MPLLRCSPAAPVEGFIIAVVVAPLKRDSGVAAATVEVAHEGPGLTPHVGVALAPEYLGELVPEFSECFSLRDLSLLVGKEFGPGLQLLLLALLLAAIALLVLLANR